MSNASDAAEKVHDSAWFDHAIRAGLVAYGVVHLLVAWLAIQLAIGDKEDQASNSGAMHYLAQQPMGKALVWLIAIGMLLLVVWRVLEALYGYADESDEKKRLLKRASSIGKAVIYGALAWSAFKTATGDGGGKGGTDSTTAKIMQMSGGQLIVGVIGLAIIGYGISLVVRGWTEKFREHLDAQGQAGQDGSAYVLFGKVGYIAKGVAIAIVGGLFAWASATHDAKKSGGLDQALQTVLEQPFGQVLLIAIALGIAGYGAFCFARAKHLSR